MPRTAGLGVAPIEIVVAAGAAAALEPGEPRAELRQLRFLQVDSFAAPPGANDASR
ncbi:MAG: hypothetical protein ABIY55_33440 [Kofleriaceae bacterium]